MKDLNYVENYNYTSPSDENNKLKKLYNLTPQQLFLLDWIDGMAAADNEVAAAHWRDVKQEKLDDLARLYRLGGAL